ncbi:MAG TPA: hypothetical protein PLU10_00715 [Chitinophagaceae bacterium]|nr:hypothetical protein [Chitinophagaceae bacterium]
MKHILIILSFFSFILWTNCSPKIAKKTESSSSQSDKNISGTEVPAMDTPASDGSVMSADMQNDPVRLGKQVWASSCKQCHELFQPQTRDMDQWTPILKSMSKKANLNESQKEQLTAFFQKHAKQ